MIAKIILILLICILFNSCKRRDNDQTSTATNIVSMQEVMNEMNFNPEDEAWLEAYESISTQEAPPVVRVQEAPRPAPPVPQTRPTTPAARPPAQQTRPPATATQREVEHGEFTASLISLRDRNRVEEIRRILAASSYFTEIQEVEIDGVTWYRLRLAGSFSRAYAEYLASRIQSEFREITGYWVMRR